MDRPTPAQSQTSTLRWSHVSCDRANRLRTARSNQEILRDLPHFGMQSAIDPGQTDEKSICCRSESLPWRKNAERTGNAGWPQEIGADQGAWTLTASPINLSLFRDSGYDSRLVFGRSTLDQPIHKCSMTALTRGMCRSSAYGKASPLRRSPSTEA